VSDESAESTEERNRRNELITKEGLFSGDSVPRPLGFIALMPIPVILPAGAQCFTKPQPGLGPEVGAQLASQQRLILRLGRL
jgi:hypothetical protein